VTGLSWGGVRPIFSVLLSFFAVLTFTAIAGGTTAQLTTNPSAIKFGNIVVGNHHTKSMLLTNSSGSRLTLLSATLSGADFTLCALNYPITLAAGKSIACAVTYAPPSIGSDLASISITYSLQSSSTVQRVDTVAVSGVGATPSQLAPGAAGLNFGSVAAGSSQNMVETLSNSGGVKLTISAMVATGSGFSTSGLSLPLTLSAGQNVSFNVAYSPTSGGSSSGNLAITSSASNPAVDVELSGSSPAPGQLAAAPSAINFGNVTVGTTQNQTGTLSATGAAVTVSSLGVSGSQFSVGGIALPVTIAAGSSVSFQLTFAPLASGSASANVIFASNAANSAVSESLTGSGSLLQHSVALGWNTSTSTDVVGYNIYRGTTSGATYTRINAALAPSPADTDNTVQSGQTYYYVVTAVDSAGVESSNSTQAQAVIPYP
jgi:Abnormal spindle-like microcephaly-assoc'd, ASPM-SPD-2-Hydin